jgi:putative hemolysin
MLTVGSSPFALINGAMSALRRRMVRDLHGLPETLARVGHFELKFAVTKKEIRAVQRMRYRVFFEEGGAIAAPLARAQRRDNCPFDRVCDHIIVVDHNAASRNGRKSRVVGAYRVLRQDALTRPDRFYSASEFDVASLVQRHPDKKFMELGRSCVLPEYRARRVLDLLWRGVLTYVQHHGVDVMFGCASLPGADPRLHADALGFLRAHASADNEWRTSAVPVRGAYAAEAGLQLQLRDGAPSGRRALTNLPPLIKGYLRLGATFGDDVFVDRAFGTTDVFVVLPVTRIQARYIEHFGAGTGESVAA